MRFYLYWTFIVTSLPFILRKPFWGLLIYTFFNIFRPELFFWGRGYNPTRYSMQIVMITLLLGIIIHSTKINFKRLQNREFILMLLLYLGVVASIVFSDYRLPRQMYYSYELIKASIFCAAVILLAHSPKKIITYQNFLFFIIFLLSLWGIEQHFRGNVRLEKLGSFDSNGVAALFVLFLPLAFSKMVEPNSNLERLFGYLASASIILAVIFTQSRGGLLGVIAASLIYLYHSKRKTQIILAMLITAAVASPFMSAQYSERMKTMSSEESLDASATSRFYLWQAGLMIFADNPVFGSGLQSYPYEKQKYRERFDHLDYEFVEMIFRTNQPKVTHNTYIKFLSECGLAGGIPIFLLIVGTFWANGKIRKTLPSKDDDAKKLFTLLTAVECGIWGNCVCNFFIDANFMVFPYIQIISCSVIRSFILEKSKQSLQSIDPHPADITRQLH